MQAKVGGTILEVSTWEKLTADRLLIVGKTDNVRPADVMFRGGKMTDVVAPYPGGPWRSLSTLSAESWPIDNMFVCRFEFYDAKEFIRLVRNWLMDHPEAKNTLPTTQKAVPVLPDRHRKFFEDP